MLDVTGFVVVSLVAEESVTGDSGTGAKVVVSPSVGLGGGVWAIVVGCGTSAGAAVGGPPAFLESEVLLPPGLVVVVAFVIVTGGTVGAGTVTVPAGVNAGVKLSWGATGGFVGLVDTSEGPCRKEKQDLVRCYPEPFCI